MSEAIAADEWAGTMGERWFASVDTYESMLMNVGRASLEHAAFAPGERVIDVGCGGGWTTRRIAAAVAPGGGVLGLDISAALVAEARRRAEREGSPNCGFVAGDAATSVPPGIPYDRLYSRFGTMFFADPARAFVNLHALLRPGGRADFAVWSAPDENPWASGVMAVVRRHIDLPTPAPDAPGPFALADPQRFLALLEGAGFGQCDFRRWQGAQPVGGEGRDAAAAADFVLEHTHFADALVQAPEATRRAVREEVVALFRRYETPQGVCVPATAWFVSARA